jgi:hypothetical protein
VGPFVLGAPIRLAANPVAKKAQSKSLEGAPLMLPIGLVAEGRGPRSSPLYPKVLGPAFQTGGAPLFCAAGRAHGTDQEQESGGTSGQARSGGGLEGAGQASLIGNKGVSSCSSTR